MTIGGEVIAEITIADSNHTPVAVISDDGIVTFGDYTSYTRYDEEEEPEPEKR